MSQQDPPGGGPPPGWYPDPERDEQQRWWNGRHWTDHTAPGSPRSAQRPPAADAGQSWPARAGPYGPPEVDTWLWQSIAVTLLCCMPLGIVGIVFAAQAQGALSSGNVAEARRKADVARNVTIAGFVIGLFAIPLVLLVQM